MSCCENEVELVEILCHLKTLRKHIFVSYCDVDW